jgi:hypothetical protein
MPGDNWVQVRNCNWLHHLMVFVSSAIFAVQDVLVAVV